MKITRAMLWNETDSIAFLSDVDGKPTWQCYGRDCIEIIDAPDEVERLQLCLRGSSQGFLLFKGETYYNITVTVEL